MFVLVLRLFVLSCVSALTIDESLLFQQIDGFGAALTQSSAWLFKNALSPAQRRDIFQGLFSRSDDAIGFSTLRICIGTSDFRLADYTYDDTSGPDMQLSSFSIARDNEEIIPMLHEILAVNSAIRIVAAPWSPPAWMKTSKQLGGGSLIASEEIYAVYAEYFVRFIQAYKDAGVEIYAISLQNEPQNSQPDFPSMLMTPEEQARLVVHVGRRFAANKITTKLLVWDHNWDQPQFPLAVLSNATAAQYIDGVAWHGYGGEPSAQSKVKSAFQDKEVFFTEICSGDWSPDFGSGLMWDAQNIVIGSTRNWARTVLKWNIALDENHGPKLPSGCNNCRGVIKVDQSASGTITLNEDFYALAHASKFVLPGAIRIGSDEATSVAFKNPTDTIVLIAMNSNSGPVQKTIRWGNYVLTYNLTAISLNTFVWDPSAIDPSGAISVNITTTTGDQSNLLKNQPQVKFVPFAKK